MAEEDAYVGRERDPDEVHRDENAPIGTRHSHYASPGDGPFRCDNCWHFAEPHYCDHPEVLEDARGEEKGVRLGRYKNRETAVIAAAGCCNYFRTR
jgi:hypothetical protein